MRQNKALYMYIASAIIIYILICIPAYYIPFHSDDYLFYLRGISLEALLKHYMTWEGRLIGDYTGALLLHFFSRPVYMGINSLIFLIILVQISFVPSVVDQKSVINKSNVILLWLAFFLYWLCNPCLGQTSFWIVGSVIYLWPLMWAGCYILLLFKLLQNTVYVTKCTERSKNLTTLNTQLPHQLVAKYDLLLLGGLGFLAGLSNEATGATVVLFTIVLYLFFRYKGYSKHLLNIELDFSRRNDVLLIGLFSTLIGFLVLVLAPGNFVRMKWVEFADWQSLSLIEKILYHVFQRIPLAISRFWLAFFIIAILVATLANRLQLKFKHLKTGCYIVTLLIIVTAVLSILFPMQFQNGVFISLLVFITCGVIVCVLFKFFQSKYFEEIDCKTIVHYSATMLFFMMAVFSILILIFAPYMPQRTLNTFNFCIVLTIVMLVDGVYQHLLKPSYFIGLIFLICMPCFLISYSRFTYAVTQALIQSTIRDSIITEAKLRNCETVEIPDWYFTKLGKSTDKFDLFQSDAMPKYYGIKNILWTPAHFNYAILKSKKPLLKDLQVSNRIKMNFYYDNSLVFFDEPSFIFGFDYLPQLFSRNENDKICFALHMRNNTSVYDKSLIIEERTGNFTKVGNYYYYAIRLNNSVQVKDIERIDIVLNSRETSKLLFSFPICLNN